MVYFVGFENPLMACCGYGGPQYNYNPNVTCGQTGSNVCNEELKYISCDGIHHTETANTIVASKILSTEYSTPLINLYYFCDPQSILDFKTGFTCLVYET